MSVSVCMCVHASERACVRVCVGVDACVDASAGGSLCDGAPGACDRMKGTEKDSFLHQERRGWVEWEEKEGRARGTEGWRGGLCL